MKHFNKLGWLLLICILGMSSYSIHDYSPQEATNILATLGRRAWAAFHPTSDKVVRLTKFGYNLDIDTGAAETLGALGDDPDTRFGLAAETISVVSTSANDAAAGTGARLLVLQCIDSDGLQSDVLVSMNGLTPVVTTATCKFLNRVVVYTSGSLRTNDGTITLTQSSSGVNLAIVPAGQSVTQQLEYYIPSDRRCYTDNLTMRARKLASGSARLDVKVKIFSNFVGTTYTIRDYLLDTSGDGVVNFDNFKAELLAPNEIFVIKVSTNSNNSAITGSLDLTCKID